MIERHPSIQHVKDNKIIVYYIRVGAILFKIKCNKLNKYIYAFAALGMQCYAGAAQHCGRSMLVQRPCAYFFKLFYFTLFYFQV